MKQGMQPFLGNDRQLQHLLPLGDERTQVADFVGWNPYPHQQTGSMQLGQRQGGFLVRLYRSGGDKVTLGEWTAMTE